MKNKKENFRIQLNVSLLMFSVLLFIQLSFSLSSCDGFTVSTQELDSPDITTLEVHNSNTTDSVLVYLTLGGGTGYVSDVNGIFNISSTKKLQGSFYLQPSETVTYICPSSKGISGNVSFNNPPRNCPYVGTTLFEFTLNNASTIVNAQETVDISCVAGVDTYGKITMTGGGDWTDNVYNNNVTYIKNDSLYKNGNTSGVFPYGCTNCTNTNGVPVCDTHPDYATPNKKNLCNVERNAKSNGGTVRISFINK